MGAENVNWMPAVLVLAAGLVGGILLVRRAGRRSDAALAAAEPLERRDLAARRDALLEQLREMQALGPPGEGAARERATLEREAARVLRDLDRLPAEPRRARPASAAETPAGPARDRAALRGFLWGTGSAAALGLLLFFASRSATERAPGEAPTGELPAAGAADAEVARLQEAVRRNPDDLEARLGLARAALGRQDMMQVYDQTREVLERAPGHPRALSYQALVRLAMGQPEAAERMLRQALAAEPDLLEGYIHLSLVHLRTGRLEEAEADIEEAARRHPARAERLRAVWAEMRAQADRQPAAAGGGAPAAAGEDPHAGVGEPGTATATATSGDGLSVAGSLELAPGAGGALSPTAVVFVTVRPPGVTGGPPLAAKRLAASSFPLPFSVGAADSMMGAPLPDRIRIEARVDADGDPLTRSTGDPAASADGVRLGTTGLRLVLRAPR